MHAFTTTRGRRLLSRAKNEGAQGTVKRQGVGMKTGCMTPTVSIIVVNWNGWRDTLECLESLYQIEYPTYHVIVVDNGSEDESVSRIREYCEGSITVKSPFVKYSPDNKPIRIFEHLAAGEKELPDAWEEYNENTPNRRLTLIINGQNAGFAEGNNIGMRFAQRVQTPDYVLLLNNDVVVDRMFLTNLVSVGEMNDRIGFVGPKIYHYSNRNILQYTGGGTIKFHKGWASPVGWGEEDFGQFNFDSDVDYVAGVCILCRRSVIDAIGLMSPDYFLYWEETDWCRRGYLAGFASWYTHRSAIWHKGEASNIGSRSIYYYTRNRFLFMKKYANPLQYLSFLLYFFIFWFWFQSGIYLLYHRNMQALSAFVKATADGCLIHK